MVVFCIYVPYFYTDEKREPWGRKSGIVSLRGPSYEWAMNELFVPTGGKLGQILFENPGAGIEPRLEFFVELRFRTVEIDEEEMTPLFRTNSIVVPVRSWKQLAGQTYEFPYAPKPGSVDAAMMLFGEQNPADVTSLTFGEIETRKIEVQFDTEVDFEIEADRDDLEQMEMNFALFLDVAPLRVGTSIEKKWNGDESAITGFVGTLVDLDDYAPIEKVPGGFVFPIR